MLLPIGQLMLANAAGPQRMGRVMSIVAIPAMLAPIFGPTLGGLIVDNTSWRWIFYVNVPIGIVAIVAALRFLPRSERCQAEKLDLRGFLADGHRHAASHLRPRRDRRDRALFETPRVIVPFFAGVAADRRVRLPRASRPAAAARPAPLPPRDVRLRLDHDVLPRRAPSSAGMVLLPLYWQQVRVESVLDTGLLIAPLGIGMALVMPLGGQAHRPLRRRAARTDRHLVTTIATIPFGMIGRQHADRRRCRRDGDPRASGSASRSCRR